MSSEGDRLLLLAAELRAAFDRSFADAHASEPPPQQDLLAIKVADHDYAVSLSELLSIHADRKLVPVPSASPALLGLVGVRGSVVPVYDLRQLLGYPKGAAPRWLVLVRAPAPFALAFEHFEAHVRLPRSELLLATQGDGAPGRYTRGSVTTESGPRSLLDLPALFAGVSGTVRRAFSPTAEAEEA